MIVPPTPVLEGRSLEVSFPVRGTGGARSEVRAVDGVSLALEPGKTLAVVGESGCGKSTLAKVMAGFLAPTGGEVRLAGHPAPRGRSASARLARLQVQMVFQDPTAALSARMRVRDLVSEPWRVNPDIVPPQRRRERLAELLNLVGLSTTHLERYPHELSGGQRQRVVIARALAVEPRVLLLDEPVSALDVSVQAQVLNVLADLQSALGLTYLFISHDLAVVRQIADTVAVMYLGRIVEQGAAEQVYNDPQHPYTAALLSAAPSFDQRARQERIVLRGELPSRTEAVAGCGFRSRCWRAEDRCAELGPDLRPVGELHEAACHFAGDLRLELA